MTSNSVGKLIKGVKEVQAMDLANKSQLADTIAYFKKAQSYNTGNIIDSVTSSLTPDVCNVMDPKLDKNDFKDGRLAQINQYLYKKCLLVFKHSDYYESAVSDKNKLDKALKLWWAWAGRDVIERIHGDAVTEAGGANYKDIVKAAYTNLKGKKTPYERLTALFTAIGE